MSETKTESIEEKKAEHLEKAAKTLTSLYRHMDKIRSARVIRKLEQLIDRIKDLRDTQYLFDSGEKELVRIYERYLPYYLDILRQFVSLQDSANYEAIRTNEAQLINTMRKMTSMIRSVIKVLPQDEIDEANAMAKAEELRRRLEEQRNNMVK